MSAPQQLDITGTVGLTPLVKIVNLTAPGQANILMKLEYLNPWGSLKDRIAIEIIKEAEASGKLKPGGHVIEATSGNTGISLAAICASRGYRLTIIMPEFVSMERKILLRLMGANLIFTPADQGLLGPVAKSLEFIDKNPEAFLADQTRNMNNPKAHLKTGMEIWEQTGGDIDIFVSASGTGGHISGIAQFLKSKKPSIKVVAVEPTQTAVLSGKVMPGEGDGNHGIIGIGPGFIPQTLDRSIIDEVAVIDVQDAYDTARKAIAKEGIPIGCSSGAVLHVALKLAGQIENAGKTIVVVAASSAERYLSTELAADARAYVNSMSTEAAERSYMEALAANR